MQLALNGTTLKKFLVEKGLFKLFTYDSFDVLTDYVLSAVWQLAIFKDTLSLKLFQIHLYFKDYLF